MKVAVIGSGISGLAATWYLSKFCNVTLCERSPSIGMDAHSVALDGGRNPVQINAPMRVFFEAYYPTLSRLYSEIGAAYEPIRYSGSFSTRGDRAYFRYRNFWLGDRSLPFLSGRSVSRPMAWRLGYRLVQLMYRLRKQDPSSLPDTLSISEFLDQHGLTELGNRFLYPTFAGICTCSYDQAKAYPAKLVLDYLARVLAGSRVNRLTHGVSDVVRRLASPAAAVRCGVELTSVVAAADGVQVSDGKSYQERFDHVVIATQANHALRLLPDSMTLERALLARFKYQQSRLVVHEDLRLAPTDRRDWSPVNFVLSSRHEMPMASIWLNSIYPLLKHRRAVFETWNPFSDLAVDRPMIDITVDRPIVTADSLVALGQLQQLQQDSARRIWLCGSYAERGIPLLESAVASASSVATHLKQVTSSNRNAA